MNDDRIKAIENTLKYNADTLKNLHETICTMNTWITQLGVKIAQLEHRIPLEDRSILPPKRQQTQKYERSPPLI